MPFTNVYDVTFPPDTQLANQLGLDLRNFRLDVQQRMGAISGLDASKPAFSGDAQPTNWNGVLFFATDTGKVYQWNNPSWTDVTSSFAPATAVATAFKAHVVNQTTNTGNTTLNTIYTIPKPASLGSSSSLRIRLCFNVNAQGALSTSLQLSSSTILTNDQILSGNTGPYQIEYTLIGYGNGTDIAAYSVVLRNGGTVAMHSSPALITNGFPTGNLTIAVQNGQNSDSQTFGMVLAEVIP